LLFSCCVFCRITQLCNSFNVATEKLSVPKNNIFLGCILMVSEFKGIFDVVLVVPELKLL